MYTSHTIQKDIEEDDVLERVELAPGEDKELVVGLYEGRMPLPQLKVQLQPSSKENLELSLEKIDDQGDYLLIYSLKNNSGIPYRVTIQEDA